jgi:hypothetical protein
MNILAAILILGSCGQASRETTVPVPITGVLWGVVVGGLQDVFDGGHETKRGLDSIAPKQITLAIDGTERTATPAGSGLQRFSGSVRNGFAWAEAAYRVSGYALDRADAGNVPDSADGSIEYAYRLRVRGFDIWRSTRISDGSVSTVTDIYGSIGPNAELDRVRLALAGVENEDGTTTITATMTGYSTLGKRCWLLRWVADRRESLGRKTPLQDYIGQQIGKAMSEALETMETRGRRLYTSGDIHSLGNALIERLTR